MAVNWDKIDRWHPNRFNNSLGVHYFLLEDLKSETLNGKVECMRRGLLLQLEALKELFSLEFSTKFDPHANIRNITSVSQPFLNTDQMIVNGSSRMSTSSSGSANYSTGYSNESSTGYSGDGVVSSHSQNGGSDNAHSDFSSENYEDFDDVNKESAVVPASLVDPPMRKLSSNLQRQDSRASSGYDDKEDQDDDCFIDVDPIPFRFLIAKCDYHSGLLKRSKGLLKTYKNFLGVLTGPHLYLYQKDTDDHQRKVIDLTGYEVRDCKKELKSRAKIRDFSFELIRPGRKTHTFYSASRKDRELWIENLKRATLTSAYQVFSMGSQRFPLTKVDEMTQQQNQEVEKAQNDDEADDENIYDDFYEELNVEVESSDCLHTPLSEALSKAPSEGVQNDLSCYYAVTDDEGSKQTLYAPERFKKSPPERPPLPKVLIAQRPPAERPLPEAPEEVSFDGDDSSDDIYCEIEGDESMESSNLLMCTHSLSQEIFDTINRRGTPLPELNQCLTTPSKKYSQLSNQRREEEEEFESYDVPSDVSIFSVPPNRQNTCRMPSLPPKGVPITPTDGDDYDSDYKVPTFSIFPDNIYDVPPLNPVAVLQETEINDTAIYDITASTTQNEVGLSVVSSEKRISEQDYGNHDSPKKVTKLNFPSETEDTSNSIEPTANESENDIRTNYKNDSKQLDICTSNSVKDLIAKLNQNESQKESLSSKTYGSFKHKIYEPNKLLIANQKESDGGSSVGSTVCAVEKELEVKMKENPPNYELEKNNHNDKNSYTVTKIKTCTIENNVEVTENLKNKFTNFLDKNFPLISPTLSRTEYSKEDSAHEKLSVYVAKFAFVSIDPETLSFSRGDEITVKETTDETRWWKGIIKGKEGLVPKEYLRKKEETTSSAYVDSSA